MERIFWSFPRIGEEERKALEECIDTEWIGGNGPQMRRFEKEFAETFSVKHAMAVANGTAALVTAIMAIPEKVRKVAVPTFTFVATYNAPKLLSLETELFDCHRGTFNISKDQLGSGEWDLVIPVHVGGLPADMDEIMEMAASRNAWVIEDAAEAIGATYRGRNAGTMSDLGIFSFHAAKVVATGEGGMIVTNNDELADRCREIINQGYSSDTTSRKPWEYLHSSFGLNFRMTEMQAALGRVQLEKLSGFLELRQKLAERYKELLGDNVGYQEVPGDRYHPYFLFPILVEPEIRETLLRHLDESGIQAKVTWRPVHRQPFYSDGGGPFDNAEWIWKRVVSLPIHNCLKPGDVDRICKSILEIVSG